ncbi:substrate-binding domain-containing protein [Geofilum rubicundum]|uniref:substrate-binding domain-containing protein n=1 Tax=Geofilum rubicundum TaxID=472113 RepID=UPI001D0DED44|nr:substrate-binding domain-containing protein [Geofilum rubicundum]
MVTFVLSGLFSACSSKEDIKIGFLFSSDITYRFVVESNYFAERARELGAEVIIDQADNNAALQYQKAMEMKEQGVDMLVLIYINEITANAIVRDFNEVDIPVMAYNRLLVNSDLDMYIAGNNQSLGEGMAGYALSQVPRGNYMLFGGDKFDRNAVELQASIDSVLAPSIDNGQINILYKTFTENWDPKNAAFELKQFLNNSETHPDVIISCFDGMSHEMLDVLSEWDLDGEVIITGQDAQIESVQDIAAGKQQMTMYHPFKEIAYTAADVAVALIKGDKLDDFNVVYTDNGFKQVPTVQINSILVTRDNLDEVLIEGGVYTRDEVY